MSNRVQDMGEQNYILFEENRQLKEKVIEQQSRSMRENLIFKGVPDDYNPDEDTEAILKDFIKNLNQKNDKSPRGIVAKFERRKDRNMVLSAAIQKLKNKKQFVVHEQYPIEIIERRRELVLILKDARTKGHEAVLKEDRLYIDKKRFYPRTSSQHPPPPVAMDHVGCSYVPPEGSKYSNLEAFDEIENELMSFKKVSDVHTALIGDFNAKTGILNDFVLADETLLNLFHLDTDNEIISYMLD
ncbi:unnamed protein product [Mytilus coruscus]|uniref:Endonuclease/exonuclease/phosphatase domain-containing protein n=1 Tax=Mytilus coruscus TaxID=42192 RepID=A0A6J8BXG2_MYTCO|nr:unnamed protein product [Mytilus coruscus]